jgi:hypothetical protein
MSLVQTSLNGDKTAQSNPRRSQQVVYPDRRLQMGEAVLRMQALWVLGLPDRHRRIAR